jgi:beta-galactosidase
MKYAFLFSYYKKSSTIFFNRKTNLLKMRYLIIIPFLFMISLSMCFSQENGNTIHFSLNGAWSFQIDPNNQGEQNQWFSENFSIAHWDKMKVPDNWDLHNEYSHYVGKAWYKRTFEVPKEMKGKVIRLVFEAVYNDSKVWLNGKPLGTNHFGYLPFEFEITNLLNYNGLNTITISADNTFRRGAIWNWGGIRRPVSLQASNTIRIVNQHITPIIDLQKSTAEVSVKIFLQNHENQEVSAQGEVVLSNQDGFKKILPFSLKLAPNGKTETTIKLNLTKKEVHLWHFDDPYLYHSQVIIKKENQILHQYKSRFGLRKIELDNQNYQFKLNGESVRLMGFNLVPDDRTTGSTLPTWRIKEDIDMLKSLGCTMARLTHLPTTPEMLDYLDEKGILVYQEVPLWGYDQLAYKNSPFPTDWLQRLIFRDYNHPCIVGWSVGNEIGDVPNVNEYVKSAITLTKQLDSLRQAVMISHTAQKSNNDALQFSDLGTVNKYGIAIGQIADKMHKLFPEKILFYTEYGYGQFTESLDGELNAKGILDSLRWKPYLMGGSLWTFNDYRSAYLQTKEFSENRAWGIVDVFRQKKKAYFAFRKEYAPVREFQVSNLTQNAANLTITPRKTLDLPAFTLKNYTLIWKITDEKGKVLDGKFKQITAIQPNDNDVVEQLKWKPNEQANALQVTLLSPTNYSICDTTIYFKKPKNPELLYATGTRMNQNDTSRASGSIRVVFQKSANATAYKLKYGKNDLNNESPLTLNSFLEIKQLAFGDTYQVAVVAINNAGESEVKDIRKVQILPELAPPTIQYVEPADGGFFVGYATQIDDYVFKIAYTTQLGDYTNAKVLQTTNKGVLHVPNLQNGQTYYFKLRKLKHNNYETIESEEIAVTPDGGMKLQNPILQGVIRQEKEAILCFEPVKKAIGYTIEYKEKGKDNWQKVEVNASQINFYKVNGLEKSKAYEFRVSTQK